MLQKKLQFQESKLGALLYVCSSNYSQAKHFFGSIKSNRFIKDIAITVTTNP